jgi:hypothetical protein
MMGVGLGPAFVGVTVAAVTGVAPDEAGIASGLYNTTMVVGEAIGLAVLTTISTTATAHDVTHRVPQGVALTHGFAQALLVGSGVIVAALVLGLVVLSNAANRAFVVMARGGDPAGLEIEAAALSKLEGPGAVAGLEAEHEIEVS